MAGKQTKGKQVTRYVHRDAHDPRTPETGHTPLLPSEEDVVTLDMDNGWSEALEVAKLEDGRSVLVDMDPAVDPVLMWAGKRNRRDIPVLPLQRNEVVSDSRIAHIIERARRSAAAGNGRQASLFADLEKELRESEKDKRVEFYTHEEEWKNKLICGDSLPVMESLMRYEGLRGKVQMIYMDPPYAIDYDSNFQQRVDSITNDKKDTSDDVLTIRAFRDTWALGAHSYLTTLADRMYMFRELLSDQGSVFVQIDDTHEHRVRILMDEIFGASNFCALIPFRKKTMPLGGKLLEQMANFLLWYAKDKERVKYRQLFLRKDVQGDFHWCWYEMPDGSRYRMTEEQLNSHKLLPAGARVYRLVSMYPPSYSAKDAYPFEFDGNTYEPPTGQCWITGLEGMTRLANARRFQAEGEHLRYILYLDEGQLSKLTTPWNDTIGARNKNFVVQTSAAVVRRCIAMTTDPGDLVFDPTSGGGTTAAVAEDLGRRWIACDISRVAINASRTRVLAAVMPHYRLSGSHPSQGFLNTIVEVTSLRTVASDLEPEQRELVDDPQIDRDAIRVAGPFEIATLGRYSVEDWLGYVPSEDGEGRGLRLEDYVHVISRLYQPDSEMAAGAGLVHAVSESTNGAAGVSVGPLTGRVTARQVYDAVEEARSLGLVSVHILGWAFEANVGEVKSQIDAAGDVDVQLVMIRPDALAEGLKVTKPEELFSPLALPEIQVTTADSGVTVLLKGVGLFNRKTKKTEYHRADSGYIAAWYLDEDYDGDCFVDCQMFFDFKKVPNLSPAVGGQIDPEEFELSFTSEPFEPGEYRRVAVKVVDVYGNESTLVRSL